MLACVSRLLCCLCTACVQVPLHAGCPVLLDVLLARPARHCGGPDAAEQQCKQQQQQLQSLGRRVLHVQSISSWAPSCIGPYSQVSRPTTDCSGSDEYDGLCHHQHVWPMQQYRHAAFVKASPTYSNKHTQHTALISHVFEHFVRTAFPLNTSVEKEKECCLERAVSGCPQLLGCCTAAVVEALSQQAPAALHCITECLKLVLQSPCPIYPALQATACNGLVYMAGQIPLDPASMTIPAPASPSTAATIAAQAWRTVCSCQAVAVAVGSCVASAALGLTVYLSEACTAGGGRQVVQAALEAVWADRCLLDCLEVPAAVARAAAAAAVPAGVVLSGTAAAVAADARLQAVGGGSGACSSEDGGDESCGAVIDDYLKPPAVAAPLKPAVVYVTVPALPRG